ncbi:MULTISPECIES: hypothetical protein [unclassified Mesorhizobium]|uniref:hypothetical protein n=1 Tax=unclassified Mesorhizobium TaxID=325217 RepID=UPI000F75D643|nr:MULTISPECIES: hypothetical protein [unclassified Mesorhizobium]TGT60806.1 hypothetical protein EN813_024340 [Mesorhizobium sp. M00.F.Ca.ET.170.01.1.1]AZO10094.1 hypothetical protein EJ074_13990 [Mesorhizobium sp. M3A.F.Ca.ET.080.04.2.1]RWB75781.1 MAG: hypothetical protein EOQ49_04685 [Mesorhizobium sp.]RWB91533.1 MAG: hypothetical protein EOQ52_04045 [Mesorhizobium sp.]RWE23584.1 MAG: hypothetical protein EOS41_20000 [Mesorhizobium sp.]
MTALDIPASRRRGGRSSVIAARSGHQPKPVAAGTFVEQPPAAPKRNCYLFFIASDVGET